MERDSSSLHAFIRRAPKAIVLALLILWGIVQVYPIAFMFITSIKTDKQILTAPFAFPNPLQLENYAIVWQGDRVSQPYINFFGNSFVITLGSLLILLFVAGLAGYALARGDFPGSAATQQMFLLSPWRYRFTCSSSRCTSSWANWVCATT